MNVNDKFNLKLLLIARLLDNFQAYTDRVKKNILLVEKWLRFTHYQYVNCNLIS